jgi:hypothetical protein
MLGSLDRQRLFAFLFQKTLKPAEICGFWGFALRSEADYPAPNRRQLPRITPQNRVNRADGRLQNGQNPVRIA